MRPDVRAESRVLLVCDASRERGSGHVMRMITLGSSLAGAGTSVVLCAHELPKPLAELAKLRGIRPVYRQAPQHSRQLSAEIPELTYRTIVFDGYDFDPVVFEELSSRGEFTVVIDDNGDHANVPCDAIVNANFHASVEMYSSNIFKPALLLGTEFALIRPEIQSVEVPSIRDRAGVFLSLGGTDVLGRRDEIERHLRSVRPWLVRSALGVMGKSTTPATEMARLLAESKVGVVALGTTTWEALFLGLPIVGVVVADNQVLLAQSLSTAGLATTFDLRTILNLGDISQELSMLHDSPSLLKQRSEHGRNVVDGQGAERLRRILMQG